MKTVAGESDLASLLRSIDPELRQGRFVFATVDRIPDGIGYVAIVVEDEGTTLVVAQEVADGYGLRYDYLAAMITLRVHSSLAAVGLTAAVTSVLAEGGISCNVIAGTFHDHLFVPFDRGEEAVERLRSLATAHRDGVARG